jgi:hypothetical protein
MRRRRLEQLLLLDGVRIGDRTRPSTAPPPELLSSLQRMSPPRPGSLLSVGLAGLALTLLLVPTLNIANYSYLLITGLSLVVGLLIVRLDEPSDRPYSAALFVCALALRVMAVTLFHYLAAREGGPFLGPDSMKYWSGSSELASRGLHLDELPQIYFGSFDVGHYYLFALAIRLAGADLFGLQVVNSAMSALAVPFLFGAARIALPRAALLVAAAIALGPSLLPLSSVDLLKDASVLCATVALIWSVLRLTRETRLWRMAVVAGIGLIAAIYLHTARFYSFAYLELAFVGAFVFVFLVARVRVFERTAALVLACAMFVAGEVVPARANWPPSGVMVATTVSYTLGTPSLRYYASGLFDRVRHREAASVESTGTGFGGFTVNLFRRMYGPFVWILPPEWSFRALQSAEFFMYPGMLVWYALIPLVFGGIATTGWGIMRRRELRFPVVFLWIFTAVYFAQYCLINLSYRQREVMLPLLLLFAYVGFTAIAPVRNWKRWYAAYWALLVATAVAHLTVRAVLGL